MAGFPQPGGDRGSRLQRDLVLARAPPAEDRNPHQGVVVVELVVVVVVVVVVVGCLNLPTLIVTASPRGSLRPRGGCLTDHLIVGVRVAGRLLDHSSAQARCPQIARGLVPRLAHHVRDDDLADPARHHNGHGRVSPDVRSRARALVDDLALGLGGLLLLEVRLQPGVADLRVGGVLVEAHDRGNLDQVRPARDVDRHRLLALEVRPGGRVSPDDDVLLDLVRVLVGDVCQEARVLQLLLGVGDGSSP